MGTAVTAGLSLFGGLSSASGHEEQAAADRQWGAYQAAQAAANADAERGYSQLEAQRIRKLGKQAQSGATAAYAASGVDVNSGSARAVQQRIGYNANYDALTAISQGDYKARLMVAQGQGEQYKSDISADAQDSEAQAATFQAWGNFFGDWQTASNQGGFTFGI